MPSHLNLEQEIQKIHERNARVEGEKAWETSGTRKIVIAVLTYVVIVIFFFFAGLSRPFINAIVPAIGFLLSMLSISFFKNLWIRHCYKKSGG